MHRIALITQSAPIFLEFLVLGDLLLLRLLDQPPISREAQALAERHNQDPATYGIMMHFNQGRGCIYLTLVRVEGMKSKALDMAENDSVQCPTSITSIERNERGMIVRLEDGGRTPRPQDEAGQALEDAGRSREDDDLSDWLAVNVSFEG